MKITTKFLLPALCFAVLLTSCKRESIDDLNSSEKIPAAVLKQIADKGFSNENVRKVDNGYLVEGDIILTPENLGSTTTSPVLLIANNEQYRTTNLVTRLPRTISVSVSGTLVGLAVWSNAADNMIARYNALGLRMHFLRVASGGIVDLVGFDQGPSGGYITLGSSGFPDANGNPYNQIKMNTNAQAYGSNPDPIYVTNVLQHEMGHCIGFRHTDYFNRALSCGGSKSNERAGTIGAILIPGTPSGFDSESFMLACSNGGATDRTFNPNDKIALNYLYF